MSFQLQPTASYADRKPHHLFPATRVPGLQIRLPEPEQIRSRKVVTRSRSRRTGKYPSWKMGRMMQWESFNELFALRILDCSPAVTAFYEQPLQIAFSHLGKVELHTPDILMERGTDLEFLEIKDVAEANSDEVRSRSRVLAELLHPLGVRYRLVPVDKKKLSPQQSYCKSVLKFGRSAISDADREHARRFFKEIPHTRWGALTQGVLGRRGRQIVARLLLEGALFADSYHLPFTENTRILTSPHQKSLLEIWRG